MPDRDLSEEVLADNMAMTPHTANPSPKKSKKLVMQVNKYIPHYMRIPAKLEKDDLKLFESDYFKGDIPSDPNEREASQIMLDEKNRRL